MKIRALLFAAATLPLLISAAEEPALFDLQGFVDAKIKAGEKRIVVPPGNYRVAPKNGYHLRLRDLADTEVIADGVEITCTHTTRVTIVENCRNVRVKGFTVDFDPLPFTEGRIVALPPDKSWVEFEVIDGYPENEFEERIEIFDPTTRELRRETPGYEDVMASLGNHRYRATKPTSYRFRPEWDTEQVGDILVTNNRFPKGATGHAFEVARSSGVILEDITLYAAPTFGFVEHQCDGTTYLRCRIDRRAPQDDPVKRAFPRMRSLNADAFHSTGATKGPAIVSCTARYQGDDCVNIHGTYHLITACEGAVLRIAVLYQRLTIEPGDPVEFLPYSGVRPEDAVAIKLEPDGPITGAEKEFISKKLNLLPRHKELLLAGEVTFFKLTLDRPVPLEMGSAVCSGKRCGNGFLVKDCDFGHNRSRAILIKASRGGVIGNRLTQGWMAAVLVAPEFWWFESSSSCDVEIRDNVISGCRRPAIEIIAPGGNGKPLPAGAHRNLTITGNRFENCPWPNIYVTSTANLILRDNQLTSPETRDFTPPLARPWTWGDAQPAPVVSELCEPAGKADMPGAPN